MFNNSNRNTLYLVFSITVGLLLYVGLASADSIGPTCGSCQGSIYTLSYSGIPLPDADPLHETFRITFTIDTTGYTGTGVNIDAVAIKVSSSAVSSLFAAPNADGTPGGVANWTLVAGGMNTGGCSGSGGGFDCADWTASPTGGAKVGGILFWTFDQTIDNGALFTALNQASIKARYVDENGNRAGDPFSENITLQDPPPSVPEPSTLLLVGVGLIAVSFVTRSQLRRRHS
jgi:PEP-CTERM motif-containing protein